MLKLVTKKGYYELVVAGTKKRKVFWISTRDIPLELKNLLQSLSD